MVSRLWPANAGNPGNDGQNLVVVEAIAVMQKRIEDQDAWIAEQMDEIQNLREQLHLRNEGGNGGNKDGNPSHIEDGSSHSQSGNNTAT